jgi:hypothetical protein
MAMKEQKEVVTRGKKIQVVGADFDEFKFVGPAEHLAWLRIIRSAPF